MESCRRSSFSISIFKLWKWFILTESTNGIQGKMNGNKIIFLSNIPYDLTQINYISISLNVTVQLGVFSVPGYTSVVIPVTYDSPNTFIIELNDMYIDLLKNNTDISNKLFTVENKSYSLSTVSATMQTNNSYPRITNDYSAYNILSINSLEPLSCLPSNVRLTNNDYTVDLIFVSITIATLLETTYYSYTFRSNTQIDYDQFNFEQPHIIIC